MLCEVLHGTEVSFQWKNPDFLLRNPDFLLKNVDLIIKQVAQPTFGHSLGNTWETCVSAQKSHKKQIYMMYEYPVYSAILHNVLIFSIHLYEFRSAI